MDKQLKSKPKLEVMSVQHKSIKKSRLDSYVKYKLRSKGLGHTECQQHYDASQQGKLKKFKSVSLLVKFSKTTIHSHVQSA